MFVQPTHIPLEFALAIWTIVHGEERAICWEIIKETPWEQAKGWIRELFIANGGATEDELDKEVKWFETQLQNYQYN